MTMNDDDDDDDNSSLSQNLAHTKLGVQSLNLEPLLQPRTVNANITKFEVD